MSLEWASDERDEPDTDRPMQLGPLEGGLNEAFPKITAAQARSARISAAEAAVVDGWLGDLPDVLDMLGLVDPDPRYVEIAP